jgi:hypothetical protein
MCFMNRKGFFGIIILAACDADCKFLMWSGIVPGSTHDCIAWEMTTLYKDVFSQKRLPNKYFAIGDDGFVNTNNFLTPLCGNSVTTYQDSYNYHISAMRQCIERAFGILVKRWGILWRKLNCAFERWNLVLIVCAKLHNICIEGNIDKQSFETHPDDEDHGDNQEVHLNDEGNVTRQGEQFVLGRVVGEHDRRNNIIRRFSNNGIRRPEFSTPRR